MTETSKPAVAPSDPSRISMSDLEEVAYWTDKFGVSRAELARAVVTVGNGAQAVAEHLQARDPSDL